MKLIPVLGEKQIHSKQYFNIYIINYVTVDTYNINMYTLYYICTLIMYIM